MDGSAQVSVFQPNHHATSFEYPCLELLDEHPHGRSAACFTLPKDASSRYEPGFLVDDASAKVHANRATAGESAVELITGAAGIPVHEEAQFDTMYRTLTMPVKAQYAGVTKISAVTYTREDGEVMVRRIRYTRLRNEDGSLGRLRLARSDTRMAVMEARSQSDQWLKVLIDMIDRTTDLAVRHVAYRLEHRQPPLDDEEEASLFTHVDIPWRKQRHPSDDATFQALAIGAQGKVYPALALGNERFNQWETFERMSADLDQRLADNNPDPIDVNALVLKKIVDYIGDLLEPKTSTPFFQQPARRPEFDILVKAFPSMVRAYHGQTLPTSTLFAELLTRSMELFINECIRAQHGRDATELEIQAHAPYEVNVCLPEGMLEAIKRLLSRTLQYCHVRMCEGDEGCVGWHKHGERLYCHLGSIQAQERERHLEMYRLAQAKKEPEGGEALPQ